MFWPRVLGVVAVVVPLLIAVGYRLGSRASRSPGAEPADDGPAAEEPTQALRARQPAGARASLPPTELAAAEPPRSEPAPPEPTAQEHRDRSVAEIRASGADQRNLAGAAQRVAKGWGAKVAELGAHGEFGPIECYAKGCFMNVVHNTGADVDRAMEVITRTGEFHAWHSGKMRSGPVTRADGKIEVTWFLFPPQPGSEAMAATLPQDMLDELQPSRKP
jgi:hypothetical protein